MGESGEPTIKSSSITWKAGKDLIKKTANGAKAGDAAGKKKRSHDEMSESFFNWFSSQEDLLGVDELGEAFKDDIWPNPLQYYLVSCSSDRLNIFVAPIRDVCDRLLNFFILQKIMHFFSMPAGLGDGRPQWRRR